MEPILKVENISKQYRLGNVGTGTLSHDLNRWWHKVRGKEDPYLKIGDTNDRTVKGSSDYVWALRDINFEVQPGEVLGIIGKNGAGKSTLLKLLSRVTAPTTGIITAHGRIASLLEVGTGFHPELTGRENIFLNGAILGMTKAEIRSKFDEIVDFAGCERYIDTPVKRYSSGMYVRLAFAVAAHLEPEILVVDEVLAVGDAEFQKKAIGKMKDVSQGQGRTVLFVSHNMASIQSLCTRSILLNNGKVEMIGDTESVISHYLKVFKSSSTIEPLNTRKDREGNQTIVFEDYWLEDEFGEKIEFFQSGRNCKFVLRIRNNSENQLDKIRISVGVDNKYGDRITIFDSSLVGDELILAGHQTAIVKINIDKFPLSQGLYYFTVYSSVREIVSDWVKNAGSFDVEAGDFFDTGRVIDNNQGNFLVKHKFNLSD
ncbi:ABC transporter ATP-binding protein [Aegicerativicinus sediminis]|uniref:ABC transporter ATP-binding protein n=1 Tax=Aegicerativicinus sediminis TaxID=2893202 RepID=UPI001E36E2A6|nr:ABC transporter ATP-binding protein [Aegicerativicinus sediminis]